MHEASRKKRIRLPGVAYGASGTVWLVTIGTEDRHPHVAHDALAITVADLLHRVCTHLGATLLVGCIVPDHVHAVIEVTSGNLVTVVRSFKSLVVRRWWELGHSGTLCRRSFHDRGLTTPADVETTVAFVIDAPVRAGLIDEAGSFPHLRGYVVGGA